MIKASFRRIKWIENLKFYCDDVIFKITIIALI